MSVRWRHVSVDVRRGTLVLHGMDASGMDRIMWVREADIARLRDQMDRAERVLRSRGSC